MKLTLLTLTAITLCAADPEIGYWKHNAAKSKNSTVRAQLLHIEEAKQGVRVTTAGINTDGKPATSEFVYGYDGKDYPVAGTTCDALAAKRVNANTIERYCKKGGKVVSTLRREVVEGGKAIRTVSTGTGEDGKPYRRESWYDKWDQAAAIAGHRRINSGTWKINAAKSHREPPSPSPLTGTTTIAASGADAIRVQSEGTGRDGKPYKRTNTYVLDGRDNPVNGLAGIDTLAMQLLDERTAVWTYKKGGQVRSRAITTFTDSTRTIESWGTGDDSKPVHAVSVSEKQK